MQIADALPSLALIGLGVAGIALFGRDQNGQRGQHDVADYQPALAPARRTWPLTGVDQPAGPRRLRSYADLVLPPIPVDTTIGLPLYAASVVAQVMEPYGGDPQVIARQWLVELGEQARADLAAVG